MKAPNGRSFEEVVLQFKFPNVTALPPFTRQLMQKAREFQTATTPTGEMIIQPTEGVSLLSFLDDIEREGYTLANAICEARSNPSGPLSKQHYVVRFIFSKDATRENVSDLFVRRRGVIRRELQIICKEALWRAKAFSNPLIKNEKVVDGVRCSNIVLDTRQPFYQGNGEPVTMWLKDQEGERIGDAPVPLAPSHRLRASDGVRTFILARA